MEFAMWKVYALLAALFAALTAIFAKIGIDGVDSNLATGIRTIVILVLVWGIVFATVPLSGIKSLNATNWTFLILSALRRACRGCFTSMRFNSATCHGLLPWIN